MPKPFAIFLAMAAVSLPCMPVYAKPPANKDFLSAGVERRMVKSFDFDERELGNYETVPMNWRPIIAPGYPRFLEGRFDNETGHDAPPSFHFVLQSGSVGAHYLAKDIPIHPESDYRISAWIRPEKLKHARAYFTAYYLDHALRKIESSEKRSVKIWGAGDAEPWTEVLIDLPGGVKEAQWIGLSCRIEQPPAPSRGEALFQPIHYRDVHGAAWFDDIKVMRLPRVRMKLNAPDSIYLPGVPTKCMINVADLDGGTLDIVLDILDAESRIVESHRMNGSEVIEGGKSVILAELPAGLYVARLTTREGNLPVSTHEWTFLRLNPDLGRAKQNDRGFGVIMNVTSLSLPEHSKRLLKLLSPAIVKIPLWRRSLSDEAIVGGDHQVDGLVDALHHEGITIVGTLESLPSSLANQYEVTKRGLLRVLASDPNRWRPYLALILTRHGQRINAWQLGTNSGQTQDEQSHLAEALANVQTEMKPLIGLPRLVVPHSVQFQLHEADLPADVLSLNVPPHHAADRLQVQLESFPSNGFDTRWTTIESPASDRYARRWRLIEFSRRVIASRCAGMAAVFTHQPWRFDTIDNEVIVTPLEEFILLRTISQTLGGLTRVSSVWLDDGVNAWLFTDATENRGALVVWADASENEGRKLLTNLGEEARRIDLWGNVEAGKQVENGREFRVGPMPVIIRPASPWRVKMQSGFALDNPVFESTTQSHERVVTLTNMNSLKLSGVLNLEAPPGWRIRPNKVSLDLMPGQSKSIELTIRMPSNQAAGDYMLLGRLKADGEEFPSLTLRTPLRVNAPGLDVNVAAYRRGDALKVVQRITNRTENDLNLKAYLISPNRARDMRLIRNLAAGQTAVREYEAGEAETLTGRHIRVSVEQINGALRHNTVIKLD